MLACIKYLFRSKNNKDCEPKKDVVHGQNHEKRNKPIYHYEPRRKLYKANSKMIQVNIPDDD